MSLFAIVQVSLLVASPLSAGTDVDVTSAPLSAETRVRQSQASRGRARHVDVSWIDAPTGTAAKLDRMLREATEIANAGEPGRALGLFYEVEAAAEDWTQRWAAISGQVWAARLAQDTDDALAVTRRVTTGVPSLAGLMAVWDGDTWWRSGDLGRAADSYVIAAARHGNEVVDGVPVGVTALRLLGQVQLERSKPAEAALAQRELLERYPSYVDREFVLARALLFEAAASGAVPMGRIGNFLRLQPESSQGDDVLDRGLLVGASPQVSAVRLRGVHGLAFALNPRDSQLLAGKAKSSTQLSAAATACTVTSASDGFQNPISYDSGNFGFRFMDEPDCCNGWHPGVDLNAADDCSLNFKSVARGCVRDTASSGSDYGTVAVEHYWLPDTWVSTYLHGDYPPPVSVGQAVTRGMTLGNVGNVGTTSCHLHLEVREADHAYRDDAHNYSNTPQTKVGDWFQDPLPFIAAHRSYAWVLWVDEGAFTRSGSWTMVSGVGDRDDMMWASTAATVTSAARYQFTTTGSGTHELWVFVPWSNSTSRKAPYKLVRSSTGATVISGTVDQSPLYDAWVRIGTASLSASTAYRIEVANNTSESGKKLAVDDFLVIRRP